jgi:hypothetical protein
VELAGLVTFVLIYKIQVEFGSNDPCRLGSVAIADGQRGNFADNPHHILLVSMPLIGCVSRNTIITLGGRKLVAQC